jgi:Flp pilus assembly protein CpaB
MEAEYAGQRRRRRTVILVGAILAVVAMGATYYLASRPSTGQTPPPSQTILVATKDIAARTIITADMVKLQSVPVNPALARVLTDPALAVGNIAQIDIGSGDPISASMVAGGNPAGVNILNPGQTLGPDTPDWRAVSMEVPKDRAVGGLVKQGDFVDVFSTINIKIYDTTGTTSDKAVLPQGYYSDATTKVTWTDLQVLSVDPANNLYVLRVDEHQAEEIAHVQGSGSNAFTLSLRATADNRDLDRSGYGETTNRILEEYNYPIPQIIDLGTYPQPTPQPSAFIP